MFTGIVEAIGTIQNIETDGSNIHFTLKCPFASSLKIDQSVAHNGCCLTVTKVMDDTYKVTAHLGASFYIYFGADVPFSEVGF